jgi:hypothetical protein
MTVFKLDADKRIIAAVDTTDRTLDALELAKLLGQSTGAPVDAVSVFPYPPLQMRPVKSLCACARRRARSSVSSRSSRNRAYRHSG